MGDMWSRVLERDREHQRKALESFVKRLPEGPNLTVSQNIVMFTGLSSSENLTQHFNQRKSEAGDSAVVWLKSLVDKLGGFTSAPKLAGLGALAATVLIDTMSATSSSDAMKDALRCVFAEEKASEVWDQIDECLKRCVMHINDDGELKNDISRIERQLSAALTKLKTSMLRDGHMSSQALKAWVNGAAFHVQMLIHLVRLGGIQTCDPAERLLSAYLSDLDRLFKKHKEMIEGKCRMGGIAAHGAVMLRYLQDEDSEKHNMDINGCYYTYFEAYYNHRYSRQKCEIKHYFSDVRQNLQTLVQQRGSFKVDREEADPSEEKHHMEKYATGEHVNTKPLLCAKGHFHHGCSSHVCNPKHSEQHKSESELRMLNMDSRILCSFYSEMACGRKDFLYLSFRQRSWSSL
ncbi:hypothetical protein L3Q82_002596 [Scortum barcoo]|uniref:Uncharacterized protein n=1 Tax=Scortum barcoo TaxID=214431 RepID=A0ACB8VTV2_9TELE|nr:hypothetical protein L3Q82_002596 [Scortum barcoo]